MKAVDAGIVLGRGRWTEECGNLICGFSVTQETGMLLMFTLWWRHHRLAHETVSKFRWNIPGDMNSQSDVEFKIAMASYIHCQRLRPDIFPEIAVLPGNDIEEKFKLSRLVGDSRKTQWSPNGVPYILEPQEGKEFQSYILRHAATLLRDMPRERLESYFRDEVVVPNGLLKK